MSKYQHRWWNEQAIEWPHGKAVCVGRNYAEHARELNNPIPDAPLLFIKPSSSMVTMACPLRIPQDQGACHIETEIVLLIGAPLTKATHAEADSAIVGIGLGFDLTLRTLQDQLKAEGHPWERAKSFDGALALSAFVPRSQIGSLSELSLELHMNGALQQSGGVREMLWSPLELVCEISRFFTLLPGDVVLTGTPAGVTSLTSADSLTATLCSQWAVSTEVR